MPEVSEVRRRSEVLRPLRGVYAVVVDDEEGARETLKEALESCGAIVTAVASGDAALTVLSQVQPDVLLSDLSMPSCDGCALLTEARTIAPRLPALAVTGSDSSADRARAADAGFDALFPKPVDLAQLIAAILRVLRR
jgi:CheY-like chemotaxis protein